MISFTVKYVPYIMDPDDQWRIIREYHEGVGNSIEARVMSGHFGRDKTTTPVFQAVLSQHQRESQPVCQQL